MPPQPYNISRSCFGYRPCPASTFLFSWLRCFPYLTVIPLQMPLTCEEKRMIGHKDLFEILAAVEDYVANEHTCRKGYELLSISARLGSEENGSVFRNWRNMIRR